jgi:hypothetical protein
MKSWGKNKNKNANSDKKVAKTGIIFALILSMAILGGHFCFALSSANYNITDDAIENSGGYSTSVNYSVMDYIVDEFMILRQASIEGGQSVSGGEGDGGGETPAPPADIIAPIITNIQITNITQSSVKITWTTDENSSSLVDYGITAVYEIGTQTGLSGVTGHEVILSDLLPGTLYHFRVRSADAAGNSSSSADQTFTTSADSSVPVISDVAVTNITGNSATITWTTNEPSSSIVDYGLTAAYEIGAQTDNSLVISHIVNLSGLSPSTLYNFRVRSADSADNIGFSTNQTFTTLDTVAPIISGVMVENVDSDSAVILWTTDEISSGAVGYGLTGGYESGISMSAIFSTSHQLSLSDLIGNTVYHFRVTATDPAGNESSSTDFTFTTSKDTSVPSNVLNFRADPGETYMILSWTNPTDRDFAGVHIMRSATEYPRTPGEGTVVFHGLATSAVDRGLMQGTSYYYTAFSYDTSENFSSGAIAFGRTLGVIVPPPEEPIIPEVPPEEEPPIVELPTFAQIEIADFQFLVANETLALPMTGSQIKTIAATQIVAVADVNKFTKIPEAIVLKIGDSNYILNLNETKKRFETTILSPMEISVFNSEVVIVYDKENFQFINFKLNTVAAGLIYETSKDGKRISVPGALITIFKQNSSGRMEVWNSGEYAQTNPLFSNGNGFYHFFVPAGFYSIKAEKEGYRVSETPVFEVNDVIVNRIIELLVPPEELLDVIEQEAPIMENIQNVAENIREQAVFQTKVASEEIKKIIDNPAVEKTNEQIALPAIATVAVANASVAISFLNLLNYLRFLITQPFLLLNRRKQKGWGRVYHSFSKLPVELAIVRLLDAKTKKVIQTRVTDKEGRYAFIVSGGRYLISVVKPGFVFPSKYLKTLKADAGMTDIYHGEIVEVGRDGATITANIPLDPVEKAFIPKKVIFRKWFVRINHAIAISGIVLALGSFIISPTMLLGGFLIAQILLYFLFRRLSLPKKPKTWGIIYDRKTRKPIKQVIARIFETQYNKLLETQIADSRGRYVFLVGKSAYYVTFEKEGYEPRKTEVINFEKVKGENYIAMDIGLNKI